MLKGKVGYITRLEWTVFDRDWAAVQATIWPGEWVERPRGGMGYRRSWAARDAVAFTDGQPGMGVHVRISGRALAELSVGFPRMVNWWNYTQAAAGRLTRLDVAWDDIAEDGPGLLYIGRMRRELEADHAVMRARTSGPRWRRRAGGEEVVGETLYIGRWGGHTFIRVYDKRAEQLAKLGPDDPKRAALPAHWIRVEMEMRHEAADAMMTVLREEGWAGAAEVLRGHLDFRVPTADKTRTRWPAANWWQALTGAAAPARLEGRDMSRHAERQAAMIVRMEHRGRFVLPAPLREALGIEPGTSMEFLWYGPDLVLRRTGMECALCNARPVPGGATVHGRWVCPRCLADVKGTQTGGRESCRM